MKIEQSLGEKIKIVNLFSILMVVLIHTYNLKDDFLVPTTLVEEGLHVSSYVQYFISNGIARFAVPLFFIISGYLFFFNLEPTVKGFGQKIWKRFLTVYLVFLLWAALSLLFTCIFQAWPATSAAAIGGNDRVKIELSPLAPTLINVFLNPCGEQYWFLRHLFRLVIISPILYFLIKKLYIIALPVLLGIWFFDLQYIYNGVYWMNNEAIVFFVVGGFLATHKVNIQWKPKKYFANLWIILWVVLVAVKTYLATTGQNIGLNYMHKVSELLGVASVWFICNTYSVNTRIKEILLKVSQYTFFIYLSHEPLQGMIRYLLRGSSSEPTLNRLLFSYVFASIIAVIICLVVGILLQNYLPSVYYVITGGRGKREKVNNKVTTSTHV